MIVPYGIIDCISYAMNHIWLITYIREYSSTGYGLRFSTEIYGSKREKMVFNESLQECCFVLTEVSESLRKPPGVYGIM